jgi:hypothetical protein
MCVQENKGMSETDLQMETAPDPAMPRFRGDPVAAAALARRRVGTAWKWFWLVLFLALVAWSIVVAIATAGGGKATEAAIIIGVMVAIATSALISIPLYFVSSQKRTAAMADACETMNFRFTEKVSKERLARYDRVPLFKHGHSHKGYYLMDGDVGGQELALMEYYYTTGHGKTQQVHKQTVVVLAVIDDLPNFELGPKSFWRMLGEAFGFKTISFDENPAFSKAYTLQGSDTGGIREVFSPDLLAYFAANQGWSIEVQDGYMAIYRKEKASAPEGCPQQIAAALTLYQQFQTQGEPGSDIPQTERA